MSTKQEAASLRAFNKWFEKSDLPGSASDAAYQGWEAGEKRATSNANRVRSRLEKQVDEISQARDRARKSLKAANAKLRASRAPKKSGGLKLGPGDRY